MRSRGKFSLAQISNDIADEADAYLWLEDMRWPEGPVCPHCGHDKAYFIRSKHPEGRATGNLKTRTHRRLWKCAKCRKQFSVLTGTIMQGTKIPVRTWIMVLVEVCSDKNGISAREVERKYGLTAESAWFMLHRLREAMRREPLVSMLRGTIVADETWIGGKPKNKHRQGRPQRLPEGSKGRAGTPKHMVPVLSLVNKETGEVRSVVVPDVTGHNLSKAIQQQVDIANSHLQTDGGPQYRAMGQEFLSHAWVDHTAFEYVREEVTTNHVEGYFSQLKRSIDGTHHHVSRPHLFRYLGEFDFRYSTRKISDAERVALLMGRVGNRRLSYEPLTRRDER